MVTEKRPVQDFGQSHALRLEHLLRVYKVGDRVVIDVDSRQVKGMPHRRFQGSVGSVEEVRRRSLVIDVNVGDTVKTVIARLEHVKPHLMAQKIVS